MYVEHLHCLVLSTYEKRPPSWRPPHANRKTPTRWRGLGGAVKGLANAWRAEIIIKEEGATPTQRVVRQSTIQQTRRALPNPFPLFYLSTNRLALKYS